MGGSMTFNAGGVSSTSESGNNVLINVDNETTDGGLSFNVSNCNNLIKSSTYETINSRPLDKINIPEIGNMAVEFEYNYFTVDEKVKSDTPGENTLINIDTDLDDEIFYRASTQQKPRLVKISFSRPKSNDSFLKKSMLINKEDGDLNELFDDVLVEGALSNEIFTGLELIDTGKEEKIYSMLRSSQTFISERNLNDSEKTSAQKLHDTLEEKGGLFGEDKKLVIEALASLKVQQIQIVEDEKIKKATAINDEDQLGKQSLSVQFNNLLMHDVIKESTLIPDNIYQDELRGILDLSNEIKNDLLENIPPTSTYQEIDYDLQVPAIRMTPITKEMLVKDRLNYPEVLQIGYIVEKYELLGNEGIQYIGKTIIDNPDRTYFADYDVVYGKSYFYKIRTLCKVRTIVSTDNIADAASNQVMIATILVASEGISDNVLCVENIAPPPPTTLRATFDFKKLVPRISWQFPLNKQRDIKRFQIFKRLSIDDPFTLIAEYNFDNSIIKTPVNEIARPENIYYMNMPRLFYTDLSHKEGEEPIYTVACVDAHGLSSNYGPQVKVSRNRYTNKVTRTIISGPNAPKPYPNLLINQDAFIDSIKVSNYKKLKLFFDPEYYQVFKNEELKEKGNNHNRKEINLDFLAIDPDKFTYKLQIINIDNQKDQIVNIKLADRSSAGGAGIEINQPAENFNRNNISFQYGI